MIVADRRLAARFRRSDRSGNYYWLLEDVLAAIKEAREEATAECVRKLAEWHWDDAHPQGWLAAEMKQ